MNQSTLQIRTYTTTDGLPHNEFNTASHYRAKDGSFYFGGLGGLIHFHPDQFAEKSVNHTPLKLLRLGVWENGKESITDKVHLWEGASEMRIKPSDKFLEIEFVLLDFDKPENHRYYYQIEGYEEHWHLTNDNSLRITNLPYGKYTIKIRG